jgi:hypothetical protein
MSKTLWLTGTLWLAIGCAEAGPLPTVGMDSAGQGQGGGNGDGGSGDGGSGNWAGGVGGTGGSSASDSGGTANSGGTSTSGGSQPSGGNRTGGTSSTGAAPPSGGSPTSGGGPGTGGTSPAGGGPVTGGTSSSGGAAPTGGVAPKTAAEELCAAVNAYRQNHGAPAVTLSKALFEVAKDHVQDHIANPGVVTDCDARGWSSGSSLWTTCCYRTAGATCMWSKPREITASWGANAYAGNGIEQVDQLGPGYNVQDYMNLWTGTTSVADFILNRGSSWSPYSPWPAMGCWFDGGWASLWFGDAADPQTYVP